MTTTKLLVAAVVGLWIAPAVAQEGEPISEQPPATEDEPVSGQPPASEDEPVTEPEREAPAERPETEPDRPEPAQAPEAEGEPATDRPQDEPISRPDQPMPPREGAEPEAEARQPMREDKPEPEAEAKAERELKPRLDSAAIMKLTQQAMTHIAAADRALERGDKAAARSALAKSQQSLGRLYRTPAMNAMIDELDQAIDDVSAEEPAPKALELAPLATTVRSYRSYMDPAMAAGIDRAKQQAAEGDAVGAADTLRMVRDRLAMEVALVPVEDAYTRVLAAQQALQNDDVKTASRVLRGVPIVVAQVQVSRPLVPIRFKLHAAAAAAEADNWERAQTLITEVNQDVQRLEKLSEGKEFRAAITSLADDVESLGQQIRSETKPSAGEIRELATRTRKIVQERG